MIDVVVNSAGILVPGDTASLKLEDYDLQMNINTRSAFILTQASIPHLIKSKGNFVHVSSVTGERGRAEFQGYTNSVQRIALYFLVINAYDINGYKIA